MHIREFSWPQDYGSVVELWEAIGMFRSSSDSLVQMREVWERNPGLFLLAVSPEGGVVGSVIGTFDGRRGYLYHVAVHPDYRRKGYATALIREAEERLWALGAAKIRFMVEAGNEGAIAFYQTLGFSLDRHALPMSKARPTK